MYDIEEEDDDDDSDNTNEAEVEQEPLVIPDGEVFVLIENIFDLNAIPFISSPDDDDTNSETDETDEENEGSTINDKNNQIYEYDTVTLAAKYADWIKLLKIVIRFELHKFY